MASNLLCLSCGDVTPEDLRFSPALLRMRDWQEKLASFWGEHPYLFYFMRSSPLWFLLAITTAYFPDTREYTAIFVAFAVLVVTTRESYPLTPTPFNVYNVVTSRNDFYSTAAYVMILALVVLAFVGAFVYFSEQAGNVVFHLKSNYSGVSPESFWSKGMLPWLSVMVLVLPLVYFGSLALSNKFVAPYMRNLGQNI